MSAHSHSHSSSCILSTLGALALAVTACAAGDDFANSRPLGDVGLDEESGSSTTGDGDGANETTSAGDEPDAGALASETRDILTQRCAQCHSGSAKSGGIDYIGDLKSLVQNQKVVPGEPDASKLFARIISEDAPMPPASAGDPLSAADIAVVREWITIGAPPAPTPATCEENEFVSLDAMVEAMLADLLGVDDDARRFTRYLTLTHLHNSGLCPEDIDIYRAAAVKLVHSLSREDDIRPSTWIDGDDLILRIDLRDYAWDDKPALAAKGFSDAWEAIAVQNPFALEYEGGDLDLLKQLAATPVPFQSADSVLYIATRDELYYDLLDLPTDVADLEASLLLPSLGDPDLKEGDIVRAAFRQSGVSNANRMIERRDVNFSNSRAYWRSFDVERDDGNSEIFADPFGFEADGGEVIFNLENGFQGYMLVDNQGLRINAAPVEIVQDPGQRDNIVKNGISCISCHEGGIIPKDDDFLPFYEANKSEFSLADRELIKFLFLPNDEQAAIQKADADAFGFAMTSAGLSVADPEPIYATYDDFEANLELRRVASEIGVTPGYLDQELAALAFKLQNLRLGTISREVLAEQYRDAACELLPMPGTDIAPVCPVGL